MSSCIPDRCDAAGVGATEDATEAIELAALPLLRRAASAAAATSDQGARRLFTQHVFALTQGWAEKVKIRVSYLR